MRAHPGESVVEAYRFGGTVRAAFCDTCLEDFGRRRRRVRRNLVVSGLALFTLWLAVWGNWDRVGIGDAAIGLTLVLAIFGTMWLAARRKQDEIRARNLTLLATRMLIDLRGSELRAKGWDTFASTWPPPTERKGRWTTPG